MEEEIIGRIDLREYVTPNDELIVKMANELTVEEAYYYLRDKIGYYTEEKDYWKTPRQTLLDGWGDCFDKSMVLQSYLMAKGIPSYVKFVFLPTEFSGHAYVVAYYNGEEIPLDTTCVSCEFGQTPNMPEILVATFDGENLDVINDRLWKLLTLSVRETIKERSKVADVVIV